MLFIHGAIGNHRHWLYQLKYFSAAYRCFALDLPGHGQSPGPLPATVAGFASAIFRWLQAKKLGPVILVGHSMGGAISLTLALNYPAAVDGLILVGTGGYLPVSRKFLTSLQKGHLDLDFFDYAFSRKTDRLLVQQAKNELLQQDPALAYNDFKACQNYDLRGRLEKIKQPALVVCGADDKFTPVPLSEELASGLEFARLETIKDAGHMAMIEQPQALNRAMETYLAKGE